MGSTGQLGVELLRTAPPDFQVIGLSHRDCDITVLAQVEAAIQTHRPELVIMLLPTRLGPAKVPSD